MTKKKQLQSNKQVVPDYHYCSNIGMTKEQRNKLDIGDVWINAAVCLKCKDYIRSLNRHDYRSCKCGAIAVDGGSWYCKRTGNPEDMIDVIEEYGENKYYGD